MRMPRNNSWILNVITIVITMVGCQLAAQEQVKDHDTFLVDLILKRGQEIIRRKGVKIEDGITTAQYSIPSVINVSEHKHKMIKKYIDPIRGKKLLKGRQITFQLFDISGVVLETTHLTNEVAHGEILFANNHKVASIVAFGITALDSNMPLQYLADLRNVECHGDIIYCEIVRVKEKDHLGFIVYRNMIIVVKTKGEVRNIAFAVLNATCPSADTKLFAFDG